MVVDGKEQAPFRAIHAFPVVDASVSYQRRLRPGGMSPDFLSCGSVEGDDAIGPRHHVHDVVDDQRIERVGQVVSSLIAPDLLQLVDVRSESTRLNSSHGYISYAVFCLKKKKNIKKMKYHSHISTTLCCLTN